MIRNAIHFHEHQEWPGQTTHSWFVGGSSRLSLCAGRTSISTSFSSLKVILEPLYVCGIDKAGNGETLSKADDIFSGAVHPVEEIQLTADLPQSFSLHSAFSDAMTSSTC